MNTAIAVPQTFIEIFPFEGGTLYFSGRQILSCSVHRDITEDVGRFTITLPPGGPGGVNGSRSWTEIITPSSLTLIGMVRGDHSNVVMVGVVVGITETQQWSKSGVERIVTIVGEDMSHFLMQPNWANLTILASTGAQVVSEAIEIPNSGLAAILGDGFLSGPPSEVASHWYNNILDGGQGILSQTKFPFGSITDDRPTYITFSDAVGQVFEPYPDFIIPFGDFFFQSEGSWLEKFRQMLPAPWYESFLMTVPTGTVGAGGYTFTMHGIDIPATPVFVNRINPVPTVKVAGNGSFADLDTSRWNALASYKAESGFYSSDINFNTNNVRNLYVLNPGYMRRLFGDSTSDFNNFIFSFLGYIDVASIHRYGYRPEICTMNWLTDLTGNIAASQTVNVEKLVADLTGRLFSQFEPTVLMAEGQVRYPLRPDIFPGTKFSYAPFKNEENWTFYVTGVTHHFAFGRDASTDITLARGLPTAIYDQSGIQSTLGQIHVGNAQRIDGKYNIGLPEGSAKPLQSINLANGGTAQWLGEIAPVALKAQGGQ